MSSYSSDARIKPEIVKGECILDYKNSEMKDETLTNELKSMSRIKFTNIS
jgi:hypothetical protein